MSDGRNFFDSSKKKKMIREHTKTFKELQLAKQIIMRLVVC